VPNCYPAKLDAMTHTAADCQAFAGGFTLGMVQAGFELVTKCEQTGGFGVPNMLANRALLGNKWDVQVGDPRLWEPRGANVVFGNPPCSGFSALSHKNFRGINSPVNACMWHFADYVIKSMPYIATFESVQQAYTGGIELMRALRDRIELATGQQWDLHHVLHNNASVGGASIRKRYFVVFSRIPFGVDPPVIDRTPVLEDVIGDLMGLGQTWEQQPYKRPSSWWLTRHHMRNESGVVDGHTGRNQAIDIRRHLQLLEGTWWAEGEILSQVAKRYYEEYGHLPDLWNGNEAKLVAKDWMMGYHQPCRWRWHRIGRVITGAGLHKVMHPREDRFLTHREVARIQGFPDDWVIKPLRGNSGLAMTWGKGIPVNAGRWHGENLKRALDDDPGQQGEPHKQEREWLHQSTNAYRAVCDER
jgi:site-specific DNA-cytosine methylase